MEKKSKKDIIQLLVSLILGVLVFYLVYRQIDIEEMKSILNTTQWGYIILPIVLCILSSWIRALRWNMLIEPVAHCPKNKNTFCAVMFGYFINHIFPRAGEIARCGILKKYENIPMSELVGTVITERAFDLIITLLIVFFTVIAEFDVFEDVLNSIHVMDSIYAMLNHPVLWCSLLLIVLLCFLFRKKIANLSFAHKVKEISIGIWNGLKSFTKIKNKPLFLLYSVIIFFLYYLMLYFSFWLFDFTTDLSMEVGLITYVFGSLGMLAPVQGGIGAYEFMTSRALMIYGIKETQALTFSLLSHLIEIIINCVGGFLCTLILPLINKKNNNNNPIKFDYHEEV
ncbi:MAG: lysylphosphatidylglycerol synthase transmembrane domain-containing protein [Bacteroidales bacterium]|nr:lysylphosphatidylglycerol synthase transmembrane domain-containing protein [Bacteroidales bacterium]